MSAGLAICLVCGEPLDYFEEAREVSCHICGKKETGHSVCTAGHYVCDVCHREGGVDHVMEYCSSADSKNPVEMAMAMMDDKSIFPNGPEHHTLVGAALLAAYKNAGVDLDLPRALAEMRNRSMNVPGGTCGLWGTCDAAVSAGMYWGIVSGSTPMTRGPWAETQRLIRASSPAWPTWAGRAAASAQASSPSRRRRRTRPSCAVSRWRCPSA